MKSEFDEYRRLVSERKTAEIRRQYACAALTGLLACPLNDTNVRGFDGRVDRAFEYADAMMKAEGRE